MRADPRAFLIAAAQAAVVRTSDVPLARRAYLHVYDEVLAYTGARLARIDGVAQVLARVEEARPWAPGLSDIDLTVLLRDVAPNERWVTLGRLWREHARLKRVFPMVGEMSVLGTSELDAFVRGGPGPAAILKRYRPVAGDPTRAERSAVEHALAWDHAHVTPRRVHRFALMRFVDVGCVLLSNALAKPTHVAWARLRRSIEQLDLRLSRIGAASTLAAGAQERDVLRSFASVVAALDRVAQSLGPSRAEPPGTYAFRGFGDWGAKRAMVVLESAAEGRVLEAIEVTRSEVRATRDVSFAFLTRSMWSRWHELSFLESAAYAPSLAKPSEESIAHEVADCRVRRHARSELDAPARYAHLCDVSHRLRRCAEALGLTVAEPRKAREAIDAYRDTETLLALIGERLQASTAGASDLGERSAP